MDEFVMIFVGFDAEEDQGAQKCDGVEELELSKVVHLQGSPGHDRGDGRSDEYDGIGRAEWDVQPTVRPVAFWRTDPQEDVARKQSAEQHHFRCEKEPDADFGVVEAGVPASVNCIRYVHEW